MPRIFMILGVVTFAVFALLFYQYSAQRQDEVQAQQFETVMTEKCSSFIFRLKIGPPLYIYKRKTSVCLEITSSWLILCSVIG